MQAVIAWLSNLPSWLQQSALEPAERQALIEEIVLGSLSGVIKQPLHVADPAMAALGGAWRNRLISRPGCSRHDHTYRALRSTPEQRMIR
ncbi:hypothetical protein D3C85_1698400 [compost metagenome]